MDAFFFGGIMLKKILVVDNNKVILKLLIYILEKKGYMVKTAEDGLSALEVLKTYKADVIFIDLIMPNIDGESLCRILRRRPEFSSTILVILTAIALEKELDFTGFGADACIAKGPASDIQKYIEMVLDHAEKGVIHTLPKQILGTEHVVKSEITRELLEAKRNFELTLENMDNGFLELSDSAQIIYCNSLATQFLQKSRHELLSTSILDHLQRDQIPYVSECLRRVHHSPVTIEANHSIEIKNREIVFRFIPVNKKKSTTIIILMQDVTEEKLASQTIEQNLATLEKIVEQRTKQYERVNEKLQEKISERLKINDELEFVARQWSNTFDTITDFVSVHDKNMKFVRVNKALASFLGKDPEELLGKYCYEIIHDRDSPWPGCPHVKTIQTGETVSVEIEDSRIGIPLLVTCSPFLHDDGSLMGSVHIARDISLQKMAANEREELIQRLEDTLSKVRQLSGFLPICASCKNIRDDKGYWSQVEQYITDHSEAEFSHSICPTCAKKLYPDLDLF